MLRLYAYISMQQAIADAGLNDDQVSNPRTGLIMSSGGGSSENQVLAADILREKGIRRVGPYMVPRTMASTVSACLATPFKIKGVNYSISSACATSTHCIGNGVEQIQLGKQDIIFAGGGEEEHWTLSMLFDGMGALSTKYNETPEQASRTYDANRGRFLSLPVAVVLWFWKNWNMPVPVVLKFMLKSSAMEPHLMAMTWLPHLEKALYAVCNRHCRPLKRLSITSTLTAPVHP